jgi:hypothetical protein
MELNNRAGFTVNLVLDKVDFVMVGQLQDNLKQDFNIDLTIEELFYFLLRYDFAEMAIYKNARREAENRNVRLKDVV